MNYGELIAEVLLIVPNPEWETLIRSKINQTIRYIAGSGDYWKALQEVTIDDTDGVDAAASIQAISTPTDFRSLLYVQYPDTISSDLIQVNDVKSALHLHQCAKDSNIAYVSGSYIRIKNTTLSPSFSLGYYSYPADLSADTDTNWITQDVPGLVIDFVTAYILNLRGDNEDSKRIQSFTAMMQPTYLQATVTGAIQQ